MEDDQTKYILSKDVVRETSGASHPVLRNSFTGMRLKVSTETIRLLSAFQDKAMTKAEAAAHFQISELQGISLLNGLLDQMIENTILLPAENALRFQYNRLQKLLEQDPFVLPRLTFCDCPSVRLSNLAKRMMVIGGVPIDAGTTVIPGARLAPDVLRETSAQFATFERDFASGKGSGWYNADTQSVILTGANVVDIGNVAIRPGEDLMCVYQRCYYGATEILNKKCLPIFIGGDHSISAPLIKACHDVVGEEIIVIQFDAHTDTAEWDPCLPSHHGNVISRIFAESERVKVMQYGVRGFCGRLSDDPMYVTYPQRQLISCGNYDEIVPRQRKCYITVDVDVLDPAFTPGTGTPVPLGMNPHQLLDMLQKIVEFNDVIGVDIVELNPLVDINKATSSLLFHILMCLLGWIDKRR
ncbi:arginase family protein [Patescibacteria group bacterium]|nr:arginase family protein [Patescibacteria group bacterium]